MHVLKGNQNCNLLLSSGDVIKFIKNTLDLVDSRLENHGIIVAYIFWSMLKEKGGYSDDELRKFIVLSIFHDIGAYKEEDLNDLFNVEVNKTLPHCIRGYQYLYHFSPLSEYAELILYHHLRYDDSSKINFTLINEASILSLADRISLILDNFDSLYECNIRCLSGAVFSPDAIKLFESCNKNNLLLNKLFTGSYIDEIYAFLNAFTVPCCNLVKYLELLIYSIDFRSSATVIHSLATCVLCKTISILLNLSESEIDFMTFCGFVHDIGKISTPTYILEKKGKLTDDEMAIMKEHAINSYNILINLGFDDIAVVASSHHEKLDGSGYPNALTEDNMSNLIRIICVADILSALLGKRSYKNPLEKNEVINILSDMSLRNKIDKDVVEIVISNFDYLTDTLNNHSESITAFYNMMNSEFKFLYDSIIFRLKESNIWY